MKEKILSQERLISDSMRIINKFERINKQAEDYTQKLFKLYNNGYIDYDGNSLLEKLGEKNE